VQSPDFDSSMTKTKQNKIQHKKKQQEASAEK
jgi:hypothetical protein